MWKFIKSSTDSSNWLVGHEREVCIIGRSNVGKSTLINALTRINKLAISSNTPGRTLLINYFQEDNNVLVDLPGYGYAKASKQKKNQLSRMIFEYISYREELKLVLVLIDGRRGVMDIDIEMIDYLKVVEKPFVLVFTKMDKLNQSQKHKLFSDIKTKNYPYFPTSAVTKKGINKLGEYIFSDAIKNDV